MKVGVFGDSYVDPINGFHKILGDIIGFDSIFNKRLTKEQFISKPWIAYNDNFTSHGRAGSDISYSVQKFLKHQHKYDKVIFFITSFYRLSHYTENEWTLITNSSLPKNSKEKVMVDYLNYIVLDNITREQIALRSMLSMIQQLRNDVKFVNVFPGNNRILGTDVAVDKILDIPVTNYLINITMREEKTSGVNFNGSFYKEGLYDIRSNHMTDTNNKKFAKDMDTFVHSKDKWFDFNPNDYDYTEQLGYTKEQILSIANKHQIIKI